MDEQKVLKGFAKWYEFNDAFTGDYFTYPYQLTKTAYMAGHNNALKELGHCTCSMAIKLTGDGCSVCNPTLKREIDCYNNGYDDGYDNAIVEAVDMAKDALLSRKCDLGSDWWSYDCDMQAAIRLLKEKP